MSMQTETFPAPATRSRTDSSQQTVSNQQSTGPRQFSLTINGAEHPINVAPWTTLLDALREYLNLTGTNKRLRHGQCGACTVLVNGKRINSCLTLAVMHDGHEITTIEDWRPAKPASCIRFSRPLLSTTLSNVATAHPVKSAPPVGMINEGRAKTPDDIRELMSGNLCRCGAYPHIVDAINQVIKQS